MLALPKVPKDYRQTKIYKQLENKATAENGLAEKVTFFIETVQPLLDRISSYEFQDYTLHNRDHPIKLMHLTEFIISEKTFETLSSLEISVMIMSFFLHDLGMYITNNEREEILNSNLIYDIIDDDVDVCSRLNSLEQKILLTQKESRFYPIYRLEQFQLQEIALTNYLRKNHGTYQAYRSKIDFIKTSTQRRDLFEVEGISFEEELIDVCISHNQNVDVLLEHSGLYQERFQRAANISGILVNFQYCAGILRIVDILDFDRERTPRSLFDAITIEKRRLPGFQVSLREWNKHLAIHSITLTDSEIIFNADSDNPNIEKAIRDFCEIIQNELRDTAAILSNNKKDISNQYYLNIPLIVRAQIRSKGYTYKDFSFKLNQSAILSLLMGEALYNNQVVAIRELIQNSIDACLVRNKIEDKYSPEIKISVDRNEEDKKWLVVEDNGIGMDEHVLSNYFLTIGSSYYSSKEFRDFIKDYDKKQSFSPISRFGIGFVSVFLIADAVEIKTGNLLSKKGDVKCRILYIDGQNSLAIVKEQQDRFHGTIIRLLLKDKFSDPLAIKDIFGYVKENVIRPQIPIILKNYTTDLILDTNTFSTFNHKSLKKLQEDNIIPIEIYLERHSKFLRGKCFLLLHKHSDGTISYKSENTNIVWNKGSLKIANVFLKYAGNRVTVNGFLMSFKNVGNFLSAGGDMVFGVLDIDVTAADKIIYDVSRDKVIGNGITIIREELLRILYKELEEKGITDRFDKLTQQLFQLKRKNYTAAKPLNPELLEKITNLMPQKSNGQADHKQIAEKIGISYTEAYKYVRAIVHMSQKKKNFKKYS